MSRERMPKQFIPLTSEQSMFQETVRRVARDDMFDRPIVITNADFRFIVADQLRQMDLQRISSSSRCAVIQVPPLPSPRRSHYARRAIRSSWSWPPIMPSSSCTIARGLRDGASCSRCRSYIVTFGIVPTEPSTAYGYLKPGSELGGTAARKLLEFAEKPDRAKAETLIRNGYLWNSGNFLFAAETMRAELTRWQPEIWTAADTAVGGASKDVDFHRLEPHEFARLPKISIDYAIMEKTDRSAVVAVDMGWSDLGSWDSIWGHAEPDTDGNVLAGRCEVLNVRDSLIHAYGQTLTAVVGLSNVVVVTSPDAILVAPRTINDDMKLIVEKPNAKASEKPSIIGTRAGRGGTPNCSTRASDIWCNASS